MVEFKDEEFVKKALETMNKYDLSGRPLNIKEVSFFLYLEFKYYMNMLPFTFHFFSHLALATCLLRIESY